MAQTQICSHRKTVNLVLKDNEEGTLCRAGIAEADAKPLKSSSCCNSDNCLPLPRGMPLVACHKLCVNVKGGRKGLLHTPRASHAKPVARAIRKCSLKPKARLHTNADSDTLGVTTGDA